MRGVTPYLLISAAISAYPLCYCMFLMLFQGASVPPSLLVIGVVVLCLPWLSRFVARRAMRAQVDDVAVHFHGEALPFRSITRASVIRSRRRHLLRLERGETVTIELVIWDRFTGKLEPLHELTTRLAASGHLVAL